MQFVGSNCCFLTLISQYQLIGASHDKILRGMGNFLNFRMNISDTLLLVDWISRLKCVTHRRFDKKVPLLLGQTMRRFDPKIGISRPNLPRSQLGRNTRYDEFVPRSRMNYAFMTPRTVAMSPFGKVRVIRPSGAVTRSLPSIFSVTHPLMCWETT